MKPEDSNEISLASRQECDVRVFTLQKKAYYFHFNVFQSPNFIKILFTVIHFSSSEVSNSWYMCVCVCMDMYIYNKFKYKF